MTAAIALEPFFEPSIAGDSIHFSSLDSGSDFGRGRDRKSAAFADIAEDATICVYDCDASDVERVSSLTLLEKSIDESGSCDLLSGADEGQCSSGKAPLS